MIYGWILTLVMTNGYMGEYGRPYPNKAACEAKAADLRKLPTTAAAKCDLELIRIKKDHE